MDHRRLRRWMTIILATIMLIGGESCSNEDDVEPDTTDASKKYNDASEDNRDTSTDISDASKESDATLPDDDSSVNEGPITFAGSKRCLSEDDCGGNYCCPLFHYCVERCEELEEPCSLPNFVCKQGYSEPLCWYVGPDPDDKERTPSEAGGPCILDEDCMPGFFCAPTLRFCVERCDEEGETCPSTGSTCTMPNAYDVFELPLLACVYQEGDSEGTGKAVENDVTDRADQQSKQNACDCMFSSEVYPDPSRIDGCVDDISDRCVACLEEAVEDTSACSNNDEEAVLSCTDLCSRAVHPKETVQECKDFLINVESPLPVSETDCICENCTDWYNLCLVDPDCYENLACMFENDCLGFDCMEPCAEIRDRLVRNNPDSINISAQVANCAVEADCR